MYEKAIEVAKNHYYFLEKDDYEKWLETLTKDLQRSASIRGSSPYFWWNTGRRYVTEYGIHYEFYKIDLDQSNDRRVKIFFKRLNPDGTLRGMPVPIRLVLEDDEWKVFQVSY